MKHLLPLIPAAAITATLLIPPAPAAADSEDFWWGVGAGAVVGIIGSNTWGSRAGYASAPVVAPSDSYVNYKEKSVWPFYRSVDMEVIPALPPAPYGRPQAVRLAPVYDRDDYTRSVDVSPAEAPAEEAKPADEDSSPVQGTNARSARNVEVIRVSNKAGGSLGTMPNRTSDPQVITVSNKSVEEEKQPDTPEKTPYTI